MDPFFHQFWFGAKCLWRICRRVLIPTCRTRLSRIRILRHTTQVEELILSHHLSSTSCWAFPLPQHVGNGFYRHMCIRIQTCNFWHTGKCRFLHDGVLQFLYWIRIWLLFSELSSLLPSSPSVFAFESVAGQRRSSFSSLITATVARSDFGMTETTSVSCNIVNVPSTENTLTFLAAHTFLRFRLWVADPLFTRSFRSLMFRVLFIWSIWSFTDVLNSK